MFQLNAPVVIRRKWNKCEQTLLFIAIYYWGYTSLEIKGWWGLLLPPCLLIIAIQQPGTGSPPYQLKCSSVGIIRMCRTSFTNSSCPLPWSTCHGGDNCTGPWQRTGAVDEGPAHASRWYPRRSTSTEMEDWKSLVAEPLWWSREGGAIFTDLWPPMMCSLSSVWL